MDEISALMDGELTRDEASRLVLEIRERGALREAWATYHLIGDAIRSEPCADCGVMQSVSERLSDEPTVLAPRPLSGKPRRRWALPSLAAAAAVASVTWIALETQQGAVEEPVTAMSTSRASAVPVVGVETSLRFPDYAQVVNFPGQTPTPIQFSAREFDAYLLAHQEFSPSNTLQGLAPYVRTVTSGVLETRH
jgi:sigma-E factor negative regulatory protein RseA